ncbi:hypothetical protein AVEN_134647-1 [Araneus ventricosus]|uniref:Peptidase A2 domain-containing protein n=1 Tax=Araneus ventricosus TaxID=182803 RepID=A0A4Y2B7J8_ARAVE|nr:hypothetical protein AVEN_224560-1 [Araneus ventricosus]GBL87315.1 hypothetical protein AVEN_37014-1 [Araneus ventricosus]GBL87343.1 hypothetical protein AVEN_109107-1 [Araneus ventricosus]GBL87350.1 hypothetical protein AVEN_134647-1 [Araneus ventricosus]
MEVQQKGARTERLPGDYLQPGKLTYGRLAGRSLPSLNKTPEEGLKVSTLCGKKNGLYLEGCICGIPCSILVDTGANITILRTELAQNLKGQLIYTDPNIFLNTTTGEKAEIHDKLDASIECGSRKFQYSIYVAGITDPCILGLDFLQKFNFTIDLEKNEIRTVGEEISLFTANVQHSKICSILKGDLVAATLVDLQREAIPDRVLNLKNKHKNVDKGAVITTCEPLVDIFARPQEFYEAQYLPSTLENLEVLNEEQRTEVRKLLKEFQNLFSTCDAGVGRCNMIQHRINTGDHPPIKQYPRRLSLARKE